MISYGNPEFEDVAIEILTDSNLLWTPARKNKKAFDMLIHVPVFFYMRYTNDIFYYEVRFFFDFDSFVVDSTNTYPAMVLVDGEHWYTSNQRYFATFSAWDNSKPYGAVSIAFEVDTMGVLSDQKITTSVSKELDEEAMKFVNRTNGKWIPARKDGQKVPSYKYFYCLFNDVYVYEKQNVFTDYISRRKAFESNLNKMNKRNDFTLSQFDKMTAMRLLAEKKYAESLERFNRAAKYYYHDATLFFNRSIANHYLGNKEKSCYDLQHVLDIAESEGFPHGVTKEQVENLISTFCQ
ncbi:MAG: energy transducer TonB [Bacteroidetes bacterium]|nr:energy transducer TonB [Bacteroidota bacterium]